MNEEREFCCTVFYEITRRSLASENMSVTVADCPACPSFTRQRRNDSSRT